MANEIDVEFVFDIQGSIFGEMEEGKGLTVQYANEVYTNDEFLEHYDAILTKEKSFKLGIADMDYDKYQKSKKIMAAREAEEVSMDCYGSLSDEFLFYNIDNPKGGG